MLHSVVVWAAGMWGAVEPYLHDPSPTDLAISACFLAVIALVAVVCCRPGVPRRDRGRWLALLVLLVALLINQQGDLHTALLRAARAGARGIGSVLGGAVVDLLRIGVFMVAVAVLVAAILAFIGPRRPPGPIAGAGLLLLLVHAAGRGATFVGLIDEPFGAGQLHQALEVTEVLGLAMIAVAALRYRPPQAAPVPERRRATVS